MLNLPIYNLENELNKLLPSVMSDAEKHFLRMGCTFDEKETCVKYHKELVESEYFQTIKDDVQKLVRITNNLDSKLVMF